MKLAKLISKTCFRKYRGPSAVRKQTGDLNIKDSPARCGGARCRRDCSPSKRGARHMLGSSSRFVALCSAPWTRPPNLSWAGGYDVQGLRPTTPITLPAQAERAQRATRLKPQDSLLSGTWDYDHMVMWSYDHMREDIRSYESGPMKARGFRKSEACDMICWSYDHVGICCRTYGQMTEPPIWESTVL